MTEQHPITPPPELVQEWVSLACEYEGNETWIDLATQAANWGADQELEACCKWLPKLPPWSADDLRKHRRPKQPSLKELALEALQSMQIDPVAINGVNINADVIAKYDTIRRALNQLPNE